MKSSKLIILSILLSSSVFVSGITANAEEEIPKHGASLKSKSTVSFEEDNSITTPLNPINPDDENPVTPLDPDDHEIGTNGPLSIDYVSNIRFGLKKASGKKEVYWAQLDELKDSSGMDLEVPNFVQVTDKRGIWKGWHLTVTQEEQFYNAAARESLNGAQMTLMNGVPNSKDGGEAPTVKNPIALDPGVSQDVATAEESKGSGTWAVRFGQDNEEGKQSISLEVPATTTKAQGEYATTLTWKLTDSPI
ncbi:WxL domain-containing protein [Listeria monocytogenes]|nr:WxL domain-containing protein [Listeria monocytogenes]EGC2922533.1 WxL domain-containing protein [Listeria monocytogenes]EGC2934683.1 WxL domain-containing protein [Listeria monocytogenes]EGC2983865.1 WxL domain-containing protein [Listeria monocytogenes]